MDNTKQNEVGVQKSQVRDSEGGCATDGTASKPAPDMEDQSSSLLDPDDLKGSALVKKHSATENAGIVVNGVEMVNGDLDCVTEKDTARKFTKKSSRGDNIFSVIGMPESLTGGNSVKEVFAKQNGKENTELLENGKELQRPKSTENSSLVTEKSNDPNDSNDSMDGRNETTPDAIAAEREDSSTHQAQTEGSGSKSEECAAPVCSDSSKPPTGRSSANSSATSAAGKSLNFAQLLSFTKAPNLSVSPQKDPESSASMSESMDATAPEQTVDEESKTQDDQCVLESVDRDRQSASAEGGVTDSEVDAEDSHKSSGNESQTAAVGEPVAGGASDKPNIEGADETLTKAEASLEPSGGEENNLSDISDPVSCGAEDKQSNSVVTVFEEQNIGDSAVGTKSVTEDSTDDGLQGEEKVDSVATVKELDSKDESNDVAIVKGLDTMDESKDVATVKVLDSKDESKESEDVEMDGVEDSVSDSGKGANTEAVVSEEGVLGTSAGDSDKQNPVEMCSVEVNTDICDGVASSASDQECELAASCSEEDIPVSSLPVAKPLDKSLPVEQGSKTSSVSPKQSSVSKVKKAKARKSLPQTGKANLISLAPITKLTFNIKELERKGVLDLPKKSADPLKLKGKLTEKKNSPTRSPVRSPTKSPKGESPFFKEKTKLLRARRRKLKRSGGYKLPSELKKSKQRKLEKERKKELEEIKKEHVILQEETKISEISNSEEFAETIVTDKHETGPSEIDHSETGPSEIDHSETGHSETGPSETDASETPIRDLCVLQPESDVEEEEITPEAVAMETMETNDQQVPDVKTNTPVQSAFDMLRKNSGLPFNGGQSGKKNAKKMTQRPLMDSRSQTRKLDVFLKDNTSKLSPIVPQSVDPGVEQTTLEESPEMTKIIARKRKTTEDDLVSLISLPQSEEKKRKTTSPARYEGGYKKTTSQPQSEERKRKTSSPHQLEEKKRKMAESTVPVVSSPPPQLITVISPNSSIAMPTAFRSIITSSIPGISPSPITLVAPGTGQPTIIPNGNLKTLPFVQLVNSSGKTTSPGMVNLAFAPSGVSPGKSLLTGQQIPGTTTLLQAKNLQGMPVLLTPVQVTSSAMAGQAFIQSNTPLPVKTSLGQTGAKQEAPILNTAPRAMGGMSVLNKLLSTPVSHGAMNIKKEPKLGQVPNGLSYPVTPPRTPDEQGEQGDSDTGSQESLGASPGGPTPPDKDVIPLCTCRISGASFQKVVTTVTYCQALDSVDGKVMGCCNKVTNYQLVRPAVKIPFMSVCEQHRKRLRLHQCCPGCGHFCAQGKFYRCREEGPGSQHHFHPQCHSVKHGKNHCPHCGEESQQLEVYLSLADSKQTTPPPEIKSSRIQCKAKMSVGLKGGEKEGEDEEITVVSRYLEKPKKTLSTKDVTIGPDKVFLQKVLNGLSQERPKKYRTLPKCLYTPAYDKDLERVVYMLEDGHDPNEKYDDLDDQTALHGAATVGALAIVHVLVQAGANTNSQDKNLRTPLMYAVENNHLQVVKTLLKAGTIIDSKADDGMTALHYAAKAGHVGVIKLLLDTEELNIDVTDDGGWTPLIWAAEHQELGAVRFLMKRGADPNLRDSEENTSLHWAAFSGCLDIAEVFLNANCELDSPNMHGDRPLHIAARQDHYECVVLFLARGADVEGKNLKNETPMECCIDQTSPVWLALRVNRQLKGFAAKRMGRTERLVHRDISKGRENIPIPCVNCIDDEGVPGDYQYVTDNVETKTLNINRVLGSLQCCQCKDDCSSLYCACGKNSVRCWYDKNGRLVPEFNMHEPPIIFECNKACQCWTTCNNRVVQNGVMSRLQVFRTQGRGWGCRTLVNIPKGTFICEYIGEHISDHEADRREDDSYLFDLDNLDGETYCIDARKYGNIARFINHLCEPNLVPVKVFIDYQDLRFPRICFFASRDIQAMEELGFDYGEKFWIIKWKHFLCECGTAKCRYSKDTMQKTIEEYNLRHEDDGEAGKEAKKETK